MNLRLRGGDRKYCIAGNWKMNPATLDEAKKLASDVSFLAIPVSRSSPASVCHGRQDVERIFPCPNFFRCETSYAWV
jgi:hypothetical protein